MDLHALSAQLEDAGQDDARAVLAHLVALARECRTGSVPAVDAEACPNCGGPARTARSPYCGDLCREEAAFVRQFRQSLADGRVAERERQERLGQALWHLLGGGYPHRLPLIPPSASKQALKREQGRCQGCGAPATTFDHFGSG